MVNGRDSWTVALVPSSLEIWVDDEPAVVLLMTGRSRPSSVLRGCRSWNSTVGWCASISGEVWA
jgi:hypothetical protein